MYSFRVLIQQHGEACSLAHFARLFQRQLVEVKKSPFYLSLSFFLSFSLSFYLSYTRTDVVLLYVNLRNYYLHTHSQSCRYPLHYRLSPSSQGEGGGGGGGVESDLGGGGGLMGQLGKTDPQRLMR